jgi:lipopolysaccharide/colanic/teichoic acid biosynthesis glycosyltransferase
MSETFYGKYGKRALDLICAGILALPAGLLVVLAALAVKVETHGPAFFIQERPGKKSKPFHLYKLRTMITATEKDGVPLSDMERITRSGRMIRALSLDELPQLLNIIKGDMSFIGPRPLLMQYLPLYSKKQARRHEVRPGISGWAQVKGRNALSWEEKFRLDVFYVDHISLKMDAAIMVKTLVNVLRRQDVNASQEMTMQPFAGSGKQVGDG